MLVYLAAICSGAMLWLAPALTGRAAEAVTNRPLRSLFAGLGTAVAGIVGVPGIAAVVVLLSVVVWLVSLGGLALPVVLVGVSTELVWLATFIVAMGWIAHVVVALAAGRLAVPQWGAFAPIALAIGALSFLEAIPLLGPILGGLIALLGLGGLFSAIAGLESRSPEGRPHQVAPAEAVAAT